MVEVPGRREWLWVCPLVSGQNMLVKNCYKFFISFSIFFVLLATIFHWGKKDMKNYNYYIDKKKVHIEGKCDKIMCVCNVIESNILGREI